MTFEHDPARQEEMAAALQATGRYKILRLLGEDASIRHGEAYVGSSRQDVDEIDDLPTSIGCVVDVETTGLDIERHPIIELALRRFRFDGSGHIVKLDRPYAWLQDPGTPLDPKIVALTGLTDADLTGQSIDEEQASTLLRSADVIIAHHAQFDRPRIERRLPQVAGMAWACTMAEVDWPTAGFDGLKLAWLLAQCGWFHGAHRAGADVDAVLAILAHRLPTGRTALSELLETASTPGCLVRAVGAHFDVKDALKGRGYRWDASSSVWGREIRGSERDAEEAWLAEHVYAPCHRPRMSGPSVTDVTWYQRHV